MRNVRKNVINSSNLEGIACVLFSGKFEAIVDFSFFYLLLLRGVGVEIWLFGRAYYLTRWRWRVIDKREIQELRGLNLITSNFVWLRDLKNKNRDWLGKGSFPKDRENSCIDFSHDSISGLKEKWWNFFCLYDFSYTKINKILGKSYYFDTKIRNNWWIHKKYNIQDYILKYQKMYIILQVRLKFGILSHFVWWE